MTQPQLNFENPYVDITSRKSRANPASVEANKTIAKTKHRDREEVLRIIRERGRTHSKEVARIMGREIHQISGRVSELLYSDPPLIRIVEGERREKCNVIEIVK